MDGRPPLGFLKVLDKLPAGKYQRIPYSDGPNTIGLDVPIGVERDEVLQVLIAQVKEIVAAVSSVQPNKPIKLDH